MKKNNHYSFCLRTIIIIIRSCLSLVCFLWFGVLTIRAVDHYVVPPGTGGVTPAPNYTNWDTASTNIQWAVDAAVAPETVWVSNGVYVLTNTISLASGITLKNFSTNPVDTTLDGNLTVRCVYMSHASAVLDGFTVTRGSNSTEGGGVRAVSGAMVTNCTIISNRASSHGGGVQLEAGGRIINSRIYDNVLDGPAMGGGIEIKTSGLIKDCLIVGNTATNNGNAGGIYLLSGGTVCDSVIRSNSTAVSGGGIYFSNGGTVSNCLIADNVISNNDANNNYGGGIYVDGAGFLIQSCIISNNRAINPGPWREYGAGIAIQGAALTNYIQSCTIVGNYGEYSGGNVWVGDSGAVSMENCQIINGYGYRGGGIYAYFGSGSLFRNCLVAGNRSGADGGGVFTRANTFENCTIVSNYAASEYGGGFSSVGTSTVINTIIYLNLAPAHSESSNYYNYTSIGVFSNCCMAPTNLLDSVSGSGNFDNNPLLVNYEALNCRLTKDSPSVNRGLNLPWMGGALDLDGHRRVDRFSGIVDVGCYEYLPRGTMFQIGE